MATTPRSPAAGTAGEGAVASVSLACPHVLVMTGQIDAAVVEAFSDAGRLSRVRVVDLSAVSYLHREAVVLLLRCAQQVTAAYPGRQVRVRGASPGVWQVLQLRGAGVLLGLGAPAPAASTPRLAHRWPGAPARRSTL